MMNSPIDEQQVSAHAARPQVPSEAGAEIITPLPVRKKDDRATPSGSARTYLFRTATLLIALGMILLGGGGLWHYLKKDSFLTEMTADSKRPVKTEPAAKAVEPPPAAADPNRLAAEKAAAEEKLAEFLKVKDKLDRLGVAEWGGQPYADMTKLGQEADASFIKEEYGSAAKIYAQATAAAEQLAAGSGDALKRLLEEGRTALDTGDGILAQRKFKAALMIDSSSPVARRGLQRAQTIAAVMQLIESGRRHEKESDLSLAQADYHQALVMDPDAEEARKALTRVQGLSAQAQFERLMSEGLAAVDRNDPELARTKLLQAKALKPDSREVHDALYQADEAIRLKQIAGLQQDARAAEKNEDWEKALRSYLAVLNLDKNLQFAASGKERALEQIRLAKRVQFFLNQPQVLQSDQQLGNALLLLDEAGETLPKGPRLTAQLMELKQLVELARTPVKISITSDNLTDVAVYKVGKLGKFSNRELELRPGIYTVVGARDGYQDVRQEIEVKPGQESLHITVTCRVKI